MTRIRELDGLRFFAILAVMAVHYRPPFRTGLGFLSLGWAGVDLFFVISGFLITTILVSLCGTPRPYRVFYWRRTLRIFPAYYFVLFALIVLSARSHSGQRLDWHLGSWLFLDSFRNLQKYGTAVISVLHGHPLEKQRLPLGTYFFTEYKDGFSIFWSLSIEEIFYLIWTPIVFHFSRRTLITIGLLAIVLCPCLRVLCHGSQWEFFFFPCRFDTLMIGSLLSILVIALGRGEIRRSTLVGGLRLTGGLALLCLLPLCMHDGLFDHMELRSALSFTAFGYSLLGLMFASIVGLSVLHAESAKWWCRLLRLRPMVYVGTISYMMYMTHILVWVTFYKFLCRLEGRGATPGILVGLLSATGTIVVAGISWRFFEQPILSLRNGNFSVPARALKSDFGLLHPLRQLKLMALRRSRQLPEESAKMMGSSRS